MTNTVITLFNLFHFTPLNEREKELFNFNNIIINRFIHNLDKDIFYLGGHIKMKHNDVINLDSIQKVREINERITCEYGAPCNSWEAASIYTAEKEVELIEKMIKAYNLIMEIREKEKEKDSLHKYDNHYPYYY
jgi:hypothetical protein